MAIGAGRRMDEGKGRAMNVYIPTWTFYVCGGFVLFVAGVVTMFVIGILAGRRKLAKTLEIVGVEVVGEHEPNGNIT